MLAFSVREALREAVAAFGPARALRRPGLPGDPGAGVLGGRGGAGGGAAVRTATVVQAHDGGL